MRVVARFTALTCLCGLLAVSADAAARQSGLPKGIVIEVDGQFRSTEGGDHTFSGPVAIRWEDARIQADRLTIRANRHIEAEGNVLLAWQGNHVFGSRLEYDLTTERGVLEQASGQVQSDYIFVAERMEKIGPNTIHLTSARVTTCTQPRPYWSFAVSSATITVDGYARMWNVRFEASRLPVLYLPYLVWPIKTDRAAGLLFPEFHSTRNRGRAVTQELFIPLGRSADLTLLGRYYTEAGLGGGGELRFIPNSKGAATLNGFYINDKVAGVGRYRGTYSQTQSFRNGFRMVADINVVSDFDYFSDFERDLELVTSPTILARLEFSRNGAWTSINARELRREQLFADGTSLVQQTLPEIEWRGRSRRLGKSPFYLTFETSLASIQQRGRQQGIAIDADYLRGDLFPTLSMPLSRLPWFEITPSAGYRVTHYTQQQAEVEAEGGSPQRVILDEDLTRTLMHASLELVGPKVVRIFNRPRRPGATRYKHLIEPRVVYGFQEEYDRTADIILYDEVDRASGAGNQVAYSLTHRLFAKRPRVVLEDDPARSPDTLPGSTPPEGTLDDRSDPFIEAAPKTKLDTSAPSEPVEIATLEFRQTRSFDADLSRADFDGDGAIDATSRRSDVQLISRYNPSPAVSLDLRGNYNILFNQVSSINFSGSLRNQLARVRFSLFRRNGLGQRRLTSVGDTRALGFTDRDDDTQLRLTTGFTLFGGKLRVDVDGSVDFDPADGQRRIPDRRVRVQYSTQCCTILVEQLDRSFSQLAERRDLYFRIDLHGIGKILDFNY